MDVQVSRSVNDALSHSFTHIEGDGELLVGPEIRSFISNFIRESFLFRGDEWRERGMDPDKAESAEAAANLVFESVTEILTTQATGNPGIGKQRLLLIDVVQKIQADWCKVFPFCR